MKVAINKTAVGKPVSGKVIGKMTYTYENHDLSQKELAHFINLGYAFCAQHKNKHRKSTNFTEAGFLAVDIDENLTIADALAHPFVQTYASIFYTTASHTDDFPKFRIVFELERSITSAKDMKAAYRGIIKTFGGDPSCKDVCRQFFGSKGSNPSVFDRRMSESELARLITLGSETLRQTDCKVGTVKGERHAIVSRVTLDPDQLIIDSDGNAVRLVDLPIKTRVHCPVHVDRRPSAFVIANKNGAPGIHCSTCDTTYFTCSDVPLFDFNYGLTNLTHLSLEEYETLEMDGLVAYREQSIVRFNEQYLPPVNIDLPITLVRSPKGTGKTYWLESVVEKCAKKGQSVLLIGHRQSLIQSVAQRLRLIPYIYDIPSLEDGGASDRLWTNKPTRHFAVCVDSMPTLLEPGTHKYDVVLIDEVEQVFSHLTSQTLKERRNEAFLYFKHYVNTASRVIALDADLNELTVNTLSGFIDDGQRQVRVFINEYRQTGREIDFYKDKSHLLQELVVSISNGERCVVCSNSKKQVDKLEKYIEDQFGQTRRVMAITSANSRATEAQHFIKNIKTEILKYDVTIMSPSVGTGVDISFPNNEKLIDSVYGIFEARVNTHFDIDQQVCRVRHPTKIRTWISPETSRFCTDQEVIRREVSSTDRQSRQLISIDPDGTLRYREDDEYLNLYADVKAMQRGSKNNLRYHFKKLREYDGWVVNEVERDDDTADKGLEVARRGKELVEEERVQRIMSAKLITSDEYSMLLKISDARTLGVAEESAMRRYEIESFYFQSVTEELVHTDKDGKRREQIRQYELYTRDDSELRREDIIEASRKLHKTDRRTLLARKTFLRKLLTKAGLANDNTCFVADVIVQNQTLASFAEFCIANSEKIARWYEIEIRKDIRKKPAQQLGRFLRMHGIAWTKTKPEKVEGQKIYKYFIPQAELDELESIVALRGDDDAKERWHQDRNMTAKNRLYPPEVHDGSDDRKVANRIR